SIWSASVPTPSGGRSLDLVLRIVISRGLKSASCGVGGNIDHSRKLLTSSDVTTDEALDVWAKVQRRARTVVASLSLWYRWREPTAGVRYCPLADIGFCTVHVCL